ncbi:MAG: long-chain fatty acid--CoA ligase [Chloroherpetonaceae bacterium]|nr:long-chain fatty acid--CoA ligase [Chloroherpetonaceae bacterium]MDW8020931.1 long-chain fatty acid--CoA ligase [Chloroherpetonaceae bacterium]
MEDSLINPSFKTLPEMFEGVFNYYKGRTDHYALLRKVNGRYQGITHDALRADVDAFAAYLHSIGIRKGDRVAILSENRPEWVVSDMAILKLGAIDVPLYPSLPPNQIAYILQNSEAKAIVVSTGLQLGKIRKIRQEVPSLTHVISMNPIDNKGDSEVELDEAKQIGQRLAAQSPLKPEPIDEEDIATLIYTSGTTGLPKGVMLTHRNICENIKSSVACLPVDQNDRALSFLPLCHSYERTAGYYVMFACGVQIYYAESIDTVSLNITEAKPTIVITVPRLFERIKSSLFKNVDAGPAARKKLFYWAIGVGQKAFKAKQAGRISPLLAVQYKLADKLVFSKIREKFGGCIRYFVSGGAALPKETGEFFAAMGITILEGFGLTETSPVTHVNRIEKVKFGTVGPPIKNVEQKIAPDGEILIRGPNVMKGYWRDEAATREAIEPDGWLHTGDIGEIDEDGYLKITDRKKHIIVNSGGKNIAPLPIENMIQNSPFVDQVVVLGEKRPFLTAVIVPNFDALRNFAEKNHIQFENNKDLIQKAEIRKIFEEHLRNISRELASHEKVRRFILAPEPFTIEAGEMTPTLKIKRKVVEEKFKAELEEIYKTLVYESE